MNDGCENDWCHEKTPIHGFHEGVINTLNGHDPHFSDRPRWVQLALFAPDSSLNQRLVTPHLGLTVTGPDLTRLTGRPDRVSITMENKFWADLATEIRVSLSKMHKYTVE